MIISKISPISFSTVPQSNESDLRTVYCAFAISSMLNDWSGVDVERAIAFIATCRVILEMFLSFPRQVNPTSLVMQTYEGGYGQSPFCEAQGIFFHALSVLWP